MKLKSLDQNYLQGIIDSVIANYDENNSPIPAEKYLSYAVVESKIGEFGNICSARIVFSWIPESREVCVDSTTNSHETRGDSEEDFFTILANESIVKLQRYVEDVLDKVTEK